MVFGLDPITLNEIQVETWLKDKENIALYENKNKNDLQIYLAKREYFKESAPFFSYHKCIYDNRQLMVKETAKNIYYNIGYFMGKNYLIPKNVFNKIKDSNIQEFLISENKDSNDLFISKDTLEKTQIQLFKKEIGEKNNFLHGHLDVYFERKISDALYKYSYQWDKPMNSYLIDGDSYFNTSVFDSYKNRYTQIYGSSEKDPVKNIKEACQRLDSLFVEQADRLEKKNTVLWRGMTRYYPGLNNPGDKIIVPNYTSSSKSLQIAKRFMKKGSYGVNACCLHKLLIDRGIPNVDMVSTTMYKHEKEVLLPRQLKFEYLRKVTDDTKIGMPYIEIRVSMHPDQFKKYDGCKKLKTASIKAVTKTIKKFIEKESKNDIKKIASFDDIKNLKIKDLKSYAESYNVNISHCIEKSEIISALRGYITLKDLGLKPNEDPIDESNSKSKKDSEKPKKSKSSKEASKPKIDKTKKSESNKSESKKTEAKIPSKTSDNKSNNPLPKDSQSHNICTKRNPAPPCAKGKEPKTRKLSNGKTEKCCYSKKTKKRTNKCPASNPKPPCKDGKVEGDKKLYSGKTIKCCYSPKYLKYKKKDN